MKIILMRHCEAFDAAERPDRPLTPKGQADAIRLGDALRATGWVFEEVWSSPVLRAIETGRAAAERLGVPHRVDGALEPGLEPDDFIASLAGLAASSARLYVFHMPDIAMVAARLLGGSADHLYFAPGSALGMNLSLRTPVSGLQVFHYQPEYLKWSSPSEG